jgi:hypothetical protein
LPGLIVISVIFGSKDKQNEAAGNIETTAVSKGTTPTPTRHESPKQRIAHALRNVDAGGYVGKVTIIKMVKDGRVLDIYAKTPKGGYSGASWDDLDHEAGAIFAAVYGNAHWTEGIAIVMRGGLVSTETGKDLPNVNTGIFHMTRAQAKQIDWSDKDALRYNIDWSNYRDFAHPALKHD